MGMTHAYIAPYGAYRARDGVQILIAVQNNREWRIFCDRVLEQSALGTDTRFTDNPDRVANRAALDEVVAAAFAARGSDELLALLDEARIACGRLNSVEDLSGHESLRNLPIRFGDAELSVADLPVRTDAERAMAVPIARPARVGDPARVRWLISGRRP